MNTKRQIITPGPVLLTPQLDTKIWGGRRLEELGFELPDGEPYGEALLTWSTNRIANGPLGGFILGEVIAEDPAAILGDTGRALAGADNVFPLLIKIIDAGSALSIQVHPDDSTAPDGKRGKTEAWYVLDAEPGALLFVGMEDPATFDRMASESRAGTSIGPHIRALPVRSGDAVFIPAGTVHAIGGGVLLYEIQQPSDVTYRFDDWGRTDASGQPRELHIEEAIAVSRPGLQPQLLHPEPRRPGEGPRPFVSCPEFGVEVIELRAGGRLDLMPEGGVSTMTCTRGAVSVEQDGVEVDLPRGACAAFWGGRRPITIRADVESQVLNGWIGPGR